MRPFFLCSYLTPRESHQLPYQLFVISPSDRSITDPKKGSGSGHRSPDCRICGHSILIGSNNLDSEVRRCFYGSFGGSVGGDGGFFFSLNKSTFQNIEGRLRFSQTHPTITQNIMPVKHPKNSFMPVSLV